MAKPFEFHISGKKLVMALLVTVVPISMAALYASTEAGKASGRAAGRHLETVAKSVAVQVSHRIHEKVVEAALIASDAAIHELVRASNLQYQRVSDDVILERLMAKEKIWNTPQGRDLVEQTMSNPASEALRRKMTVDPSFLRITVTDWKGATVAASHKTLDYYQADEEYWQDIYFYGRGVVSITDVLYDDATQHNYIGVGVPVVDENNTIIGTLDALVDISALSSLANRSDLGAGGVVALAKGDGRLIASSETLSVANQTRSVEVDAFLDARDSFQGRASGYFKASFPNGRQAYVAFARTGLQEQYKRLDWLVVASEDTSETAVSGVQILIMGIALLSLASVVFLIVYLALHRQSEIEEVEERMGESLKQS
jgi:hypothetical protein